MEDNGRNFFYFHENALDPVVVRHSSPVWPDTGLPDSSARVWQKKSPPGGTATRFRTTRVKDGSLRLERVEEDKRSGRLQTSHTAGNIEKVSAATSCNALYLHRQFEIDDPISAERVQEIFGFQGAKPGESHYTNMRVSKIITLFSCLRSFDDELNQGQVERTTPELAPSLLISSPHQHDDV
ncbi:hypothetical protein TNCV_1049011 [Trichonephila clavipes]|nr:hypothetical protein TNCV_1049011 [Trichonephila clavipes]